MQENATILVVDDTPDNLALMSDILKDDYKVKVANNGEKALMIAAGESKPNLILLDIMMPGIDGYEVCRRLKADPATKDIPVIFLTARSDIQDEKMGLELGAVDYITKPVSIPIVIARVRNHLKLKQASDFLRDQNAILEREVRKRTEEIQTVQDVTILALATLAETRDHETGYHIHRTQLYIKHLAERLRANPKFAPLLTEDYIEVLFKSAPLHDIGKVGITDNILLKPGKLTVEEFEVMKTHSVIGMRAIESAEKQIGKEVDFLGCAKEIAYFHHEKWDGSGYPEGLRGEEIPVSARLMAIADVYDALVSKRVYKSAMFHEEAVEIISQGRGIHFDPDMTDAFLEISTDFKEIAAKYKDRQ